MTHASVLLNASMKVRELGSRILRFGKAVVGKVIDAKESVEFYVRNAFTPRTRRIISLVAVLAVPTLLFAGGFAQAQFLTDMAGTVALLLANILQIITSFLGWLLVTIIGVLIWIAQYNGFITSPAVVNGWALTRDIVNMFFVIFLLMMAFGIMLNVDKYANMNPGKEIVNIAKAAILVNFSRTICGLLIDLSQVIMLTFVYGFKEAAGKNFLDAFQITATLQNLNAAPGEAADGGTLAFRVTVSMMLALAMTWIALCVVTVMTVMLAVRIVHLWVLVAISPIAFLPSGIIGKLDGMKNQWWSDFTGALAFGPLMAFFLWLSLVSVAGGQLATAGFQKVDYGAEAGAVANNSSGGDIGLTEAFKDSNIQAFVIAIALLTMGTAKAKSMAGAIGDSTKTVIGGAKKIGKKTLGSFTSKEGYGRRLVGGAAELAGGIRGTGGYVRDDKGDWRLISASSRLEGIGAKRAQLAEQKNRLKDEKTQMSEARRLRLIGKGPEADKIEKDVLERGAKSLGTRSEADLWKTVNDQNASQLTRQQAMKALADMGGGPLKGKGEKLANLAASVGGNEDFEKTIRASLKAKGDTDADIKKAGDIPDMFEQMSNAQVSNQFEKILDGVQVGADGEYKQTHAVDKLLALDNDTFTDKNFKAKKKVQQALLIAEQNERGRDPKKADELKKKYETLLGALAKKDDKDADVGAFIAARLAEDRPKATKTVEDAESKAAKNELKDLVQGTADFSSIDRAAGQVLKTSSFDVDSRLSQLKQAQEKMGQLTASGGGLTEEEAVKIQKSITSFLADAANAADRSGVDTGIVDADGAKLSAGAVFRQSGAYEDLSGALQGIDMPDNYSTMSTAEKTAFLKSQNESVSNALKGAIARLEGTTGAVSGTERSVRSAVTKNASSGLKSAIADLGRVSGTAVPIEERNKTVLKAVKQGTAAIDAVIKRGGVTKEMQKELDALKGELKSLKNAGDPTKQAELMKDVRESLEKMQKRLG